MLVESIVGKDVGHVGTYAIYALQDAGIVKVSDMEALRKSLRRVRACASKNFSEAERWFFKAALRRNVCVGHPC